MNKIPYIFYFSVIILLIFVGTFYYTDLGNFAPEKFVYNKHSYIRFYSYPYKNVVHDPDCKYCYSKFD